MLLEIILNCFFLWMTFDFLNQVMNAYSLRSFHHRIWNTGDVAINVLVIHRKVELIRVITIFEITIFLHFVQSFFHRLPRSIVIFQDAFFSLFRRLPRSIGRTTFSPIEIVFQRDLWWWTRRQILPFIQFLSRFQSFNFYNTMGWKCSLKNNCVRSCLIEH